MLKVGYIGLGLMGKPIALNIYKAGFPLVVYNRSRASVDEFVSLGAESANSPSEMASRVDVIFTNLPDSPDVEMVMLGKNGIIEGSNQSLICVDNSTIKPATARKIASTLKEKGIDFLDAPVSGGEIGAKNGSLTIMIGGSENALEKVRPILTSIGKTITYVGPSGTGQIAKAANQIMVAAQMVAMGELLILAKKSGSDPEKVISAIRAGAAQCWALDQKPQLLFAGKRNPGFKASMQLKDLNIVMETAREYGIPLPMSAVTTQLYSAMCEMGMETLDNSAVIGVIEKLAGTDLL
jgi:2-hydroxy-3-oxopropionate reductase